MVKRMWPCIAFRDWFSPGVRLGVEVASFVLLWGFDVWVQTSSMQIVCAPGAQGR